MGLTIPQASIKEFLAQDASQKGKRPEKTPIKSSRGRRLKSAVALKLQECEDRAPPDPRMKKVSTT